MVVLSPNAPGVMIACQGLVLQYNKVTSPGFVSSEPIAHVDIIKSQASLAVNSDTCLAITTAIQSTQSSL